ncbi:hypothetical protein JHK87_007397 [Glycine soja]|nr:hypothetical protein JHK87_007397 [Glycine soja]
MRPDKYKPHKISTNIEPISCAYSLWDNLCPSGIVLDVLLGHNHALFRRAQLKALGSIHSQEAGKGGELTHDEATIISGALDLTEKTAQEAMTPIESTFSLDVASKLDWCVKNLLTVRAETETPVSAVSIRRIPRVPADMPLYDILNEFQKGSSHMAAVIKVIRERSNPQNVEDGEEINVEDWHHHPGGRV